MNLFLEWLSRLFGSWKFWVVIAPWMIGVRIRLGKTATSLGPGLHFRLPFIDEITLYNTRLCVCSVNPVTLDAPGGKTRTIAAVVGFRVTDPLKMLLRFSSADGGIQGFTQAAISRTGDVTMARAELRAFLSDAGIVIDFMEAREDVKARAIRLLQECSYTSAA